MQPLPSLRLPRPSARLGVSSLICVFVLAAAPVPVPALAQGRSGTLIDKASGVPIGKTIEGLLIDNAAGSVSAATLAGVETDVNVVENIRDFSVLFKGLGNDAKALGVAITPARTTFPVPRINLFDYAKDNAHLLRLLGALTFSYAQGRSDVSGQDYDRRAVSVSTSAFWNPADDPIVAVANSSECAAAALDALGDEPPTITDDEAKKLAAAARGGDRGAARTARAAQRADAELEKKALAAFNECADGVLKKLSEKWNRTRYSISYGTGWVKRSDGSTDTENLGRTLAASFVYGFDRVAALGLKDRAALTLTARKSWQEPVLKTLGTPSVEFKDRTLVAGRLSGGSASFRGLIELSNAKSNDVTTTQRTFIRALGIDYRVMNGLWLSLRTGRQNKIDGSGEENGSFLVLNYSPSATLGH